MDPGNPAAPALEGAIWRLQSRLEAAATAATREWWTKYLRGTASFRGVKMGDVRAAVHAWFEEEQLGKTLSVGQQKDLALLLLEQHDTEDKLAGILILQEILLPAGGLDWHSDLPRFATVFAEGYLADWNSCDWFCVKVLGPLVEQQGEECARAISAWRETDNVWQRRASVVAFANLAARGDRTFLGFTQMVLDTCTCLLVSQERFVQTGVGWILRELSRSDEDRVTGYIEANADRFSREGLKNATKYLPSEVTECLRRLNLASGGRGRR
ncbi:MAG TPA: DNA alkylation repair protein [Dehalococcoidia bacterium]|nr:DNA alkylation repair protein [Dehalococcoidia bacterium]